MESAPLTKPASGDLSKLIGGSAFIFACRLAGAALTFGTQVLLARWMGAAELGSYVLAFSWCVLLATVAGCGFPMAAMRFVGAGLARGDAGFIRGFAARGRTIVLSLGLLIAILAAAGQFTFDRLTGQPLNHAQIAGFAAVPLFALLIFNGGLANALSRFSLSFLPSNIFRPLLFLLGVCATWYTTRSLGAGRAMALQLLSVFLVSGALATLMARHLSARFGQADPVYATRTWTRTAAPLLLVALFTGYFPEFNVLVAGAFLPAEDVAVFHIGYRVALLISFGLYAVDAYLGPEAARLLAAGRKAQLQAIVNRATRLRFWAALAAVAGVALFGHDVLSLFGQEFVGGYPALVILAVGQLVHAAVGPVTRLMSISGHQDRCIYVFGVALVLAVVLTALFTPRFGVTGAATAAFLVMVLWSLWLRYLVVRYLDLRPSAF